jgi:Uma2 family endonuclease
MMITIEEYIKSEWSAENRHEYVDGVLIEILQSDDTHNQVVGNIGLCIANKIKNAGYQLYLIDIKVATPDQLKIFYPDVMVTNEIRTQENAYIKKAPVLLAEIVSPGSHSHDYIDKYIEYTKIPSLQYYLIVEPETILITMYIRTTEGWKIQKFTKLSDEISLPAIGANMILQDIYAV